MGIQAPAWCSNAIPTANGWEDPDTGELYVSGGFTQKQIDDGMIAYEHLRTPNSLNEIDDFIFDVESPPLKILKSNVFNISISIGNTEQMRSFLRLDPLVVSEGGSSSITPANLNFSSLNEYFSQKIIENWTPFVTVHISSLPLHGKLSLSGRSLYMGSSIDSQDMNSGNILYTHDHSDTLTDKIGIKIRSKWVIRADNRIRLPKVGHIFSSQIYFKFR